MTVSLVLLPPDSIINTHCECNACITGLGAHHNMCKSRKSLLCLENLLFSYIINEICSTTANGGSLGSLVDEERSQLR